MKTEIEENDEAEVNEEDEEAKLLREHSKLLSVLLAMGFDEKESTDAIIDCVQNVPNGKFDTSTVIEVIKVNKNNDSVPADADGLPEDSPTAPQEITGSNWSNWWDNQSWNHYNDYAQYWQPNSWDSYGWSDSWAWWKNWQDDVNEYKYQHSTSRQSLESDLHTPNDGHFEEALKRRDTEDLDGAPLLEHELRNTVPPMTPRALDFTDKTLKDWWVLDGSYMQVELLMGFVFGVLGEVS